MMKDEAEGAEKWHLNSRMTCARCACTLVCGRWVFADLLGFLLKNIKSYFAKRKKKKGVENTPRAASI